MRINFSLCQITLALALFLNPLPAIVAQTATSRDLVSPTTGINYTRLKNFLAEQKWRQANDETRNLILKATGRELQGWFTMEDLQKLACWDLQKMDQLWKEASNGRFSFSSQFRIFIDTGNRPGRLVAIENFQAFGDQVGWRKNSDWIIFKENLNYTLAAPVGHLPSPRSEYQISGGRLEYTTLAQRLVTCNIVSLGQSSVISYDYR
jgi:hypothetical protein